MSGPEPETGRMLDALRGMIQNAQALFAGRLELASVELAEEKIRFAQLLLLAAAVTVFGLLVLTCVTLAVLVLTWDTPARNWVLPGFTLVYAGAAIGTYRRLRRRLTREAPPFAGTIEEFRKDRAWFSNEP